MVKGVCQEKTKFFDYFLDYYILWFIVSSRKVRSRDWRTNAARGYNSLRFGNKCTIIVSRTDKGCWNTRSAEAVFFWWRASLFIFFPFMLFLMLSPSFFGFIFKPQKVEGWSMTILPVTEQVTSKWGFCCPFWEAADRANADGNNITCSVTIICYVL